MQGITIREGTLADIPIIAHHRRRMCEDMNYSDVDALSTMVTVTADVEAGRQEATQVMTPPAEQPPPPPTA